MKVTVLTTSYPRRAGDVAGLFVADQVEHLRERGVEAEVVSPATFRHFGIAYGSGVAGKPAASALSGARPALMLGAFAARRAARGADLDALHALAQFGSGCDDDGGRSWPRCGEPTSSSPVACLCWPAGWWVEPGW